VITTGDKPFDLTAIRHVERVVVGNTDPSRIKTEAEIQQAMDKVNFLINRSSPRGKLIGQEKGFAVYQMGEHQVVLQHIVYHIGFTRQPRITEEQQ